MTTNTDVAMPELPVVGALWNYIGADPSRDHFKPCARALHEMNPDSPTYPETWQPIDKLVRLSDARAAIQQAAGAVPEATQEQIESLDDLVTLVRRLVHALHKAAPDDILADHAADYLQRKGFNKGPFRSATFPAPPKQQPVHLGGGEGAVDLLRAYVGNLSDPNIGWRGVAQTSKEHFRCEFCGMEDLDCSKIAHTAKCPVPQILEILRAEEPAGNDYKMPFGDMPAFPSIRPESTTGQINKPAGQGMEGGK